MVLGWGPGRLSRLAGGGLDRQAHTCRHIACVWAVELPVCTIALADPERIGNVLKDGPAGDRVVSAWRLGGAAGRQDGGRAVERRDYLHCWGVTVCFSPFSRMTVGGSVCLQGEDESFSSCCSTTRCPAQTPGLRMCACSAVQTSAHPQGVLVMPEEVGPRPACDAHITGGVLPVSRY